MRPRMRKRPTGILAKALDALKREGSLTSEHIRKLTGCSTASAKRVLGQIHLDFVVDLVHEETTKRRHWRRRVVLSQRPLAARTSLVEQTIGSRGDAAAPWRVGAARTSPAEKTIGGLRCWTEEDDRIARAMYEDGAPVEEIAEEVGRSSAAVHARASALGWLRRPPQQRIRRGPVASAPYRDRSFRELRPPAVPPYRRDR